LGPYLRNQVPHRKNGKADVNGDSIKLMSEHHFKNKNVRKRKPFCAFKISF
jgi:hypothetical protein